MRYGVHFFCHTRTGRFKACPFSGFTFSFGFRTNAMQRDFVVRVRLLLGRVTDSGVEIWTDKVILPVANPAC